MNKPDIEVSLVLPCLNEEEGIRVCIEKAKKVFSEQNIEAEIVVVDNGSTDKSPQIASELGARVISQPVRGYGAAYIEGLRQAKGKYIIIADADDTYDLGEIPKFLKFLRQGYEFVIGDRFKGKMYDKSMPWANRYIGNPILSGLCRLFFGVRFSDIHCGMRGFTKEAYQKMNLKCLGMEFATEMVMEALQKKLRQTEIPIDYYPRKGDSKLRRLPDAWRHMRFMFIFCPTWLYFSPGLFIAGFGLLVLTLILQGPFLFLGREWDIHMMVFGSLLSILGWYILNLGVYAKTFAARQGYLPYDPIMRFLSEKFKLELGILIGAIIFAIGLGVNISIFLEWWQKSFGALYRIREAIFAMTFMILGLQTVFSSFFVSLLLIKR
ncbi:MAG: glycosyltransferase family 2 protein [Candidatus Omnitrophica bacterium]|nr:glycosyltransferase family 2 protein [Candidatus Omnitrophota bacterium]